MSKIDVLCVGDVVTDAFIKLLDDQASVQQTDQGPLLAMPFATKIPFDHAEVINAVGNSANAAVNFAKLGLKSGFVSNVGSDAPGRDIIRALDQANVITRFMHVNPGKKSNYHYVLWYKEERTILIKHEEYNYHWPRIKRREVPKWIYFSSISKNALKFHDQLIDWLAKKPDVKLAFQPGTFQMGAGVERLKHVYERSEILAFNREEAAKVTGGKHGDINDLLDKMHALGPRIAVISDGHNGAYASDGNSRFKMPIYPDPKPPYERTGAGDAFTSTFVAAIIKGHSIDEALLRAPISSMSVVQRVGAQAGLLTEKQIGQFLDIAPKWYKAERL